jgi:WD40 repeat protein
MFTDSQKFASRSMDDTLKLWDIRNTSKTIYDWDNLTNLSSKTNIALSPNEKVIITGTSVRKNHGFGMLTGFSVDDGQKVCEVPLGKTSVICLTWHP